MNSRCLFMRLDSSPALNSRPVKAESVKYDEFEDRKCVYIIMYGYT